MAQPCPDPSAHHGTSKLSEQASTAALYASNPEREDVLTDGKLSSRSAAASLKYARPQDLPSFPSVGIDTANSAGTAAMLAKDYKMKELWQPEMSAAGSRAALLAHKDGGKVDLWHPSASAAGNSAAKLAMQNKTLSPQIDYGYTDTGRSNALLAATKSQRVGRQRAGSTPVVQPAAYPDSANASANALNAATMSHRASTRQHNPLDPDGWNSPAMQAARIQNASHLDREMYTEHPPVAIEKQEKRDQAALKASAISMAKQMYEIQNRTTLGDAASTPALDGKQFAASVASPPTNIKQEALKYIHLQDAAHKLAQERLAKVDKNFEAARYREYYGYSNAPRSRISMRSRKRASSEAAKDDLDSDDEESAQRVRNQMSQLSSGLASVDAKKQQADRDNLLAIAQKRVQKSMQDMDQKVYQDTGKVSQAMMDDWETKARKRASEDAERRVTNRGKTHLGAGKYMDTAEIEAIAQARLKPTLDEINENAEKRRARDEEIRLDRAEQERVRQVEKQREREVKDIQKRAKQEQKAAVKEEKAVAKHEADERKHAEHERKAAEAEAEKTDVADHPHRRSILGMLSLRHKDRDSNRDTQGSFSATAGRKMAKDEVEERAEATEAPVIAAPAATDGDSAPLPVVPKEKSTSPDLVVAGKDAPSLKHDAKSENASISNDKRESKGVKGLFSKLRSKKGDSTDKEVEAGAAAGAIVGTGIAADHQSKEHGDVSTPVVGSTATEPEHIGTDGPIGDSSHISGIDGNPAALSPSSFKRRDETEASNDADVSSLSSSGLDEDDLAEGRTGRMARALGLGKLKAKVHEVTHKSADEPATSFTAVKTDADEDEDDKFEDTLETTASPEPIITPQKATADPNRETKFQEVL